MGRLRLISAACVWLLLAGCVASTEPGTESEAEVEVARAPTPPEVLIAEEKAHLGVAYDVHCREGGATTIQRADGGRVLEGHTKLLVAIHAPPTSTGVQVGYSTDGTDVTWLPTVFAEDTVIEVPLPEDSYEDEHLRWSFYLSQNIKPAPQDCYTGATLLQETVRIIAA